MDMPTDNQTDESTEALNRESSAEQYSLAMVDTIFADTLSRGMQNAITSQQNAQMASASSVTNACARILQAKAKPIEGLIQSQSHMNTSTDLQKTVQGTALQESSESQAQSVVQSQSVSKSESLSQSQSQSESQSSSLSQQGEESSEKEASEQSLQTVVEEETEKTVIEKMDTLSADKADSSGKQSGKVSSNKLLLALIVSASLSAVIAGASVWTYLSGSAS